MTETSSRFSDYQNNPNKAAMHIFIDGQPVNRFVRDADSESPAGGVNSSARDLVKWIQLQLDDGNGMASNSSTRKSSSRHTIPQICRSPLTRQNQRNVPAQLLRSGMGCWKGNSTGIPRSTIVARSLKGAATAVYLVPANDLGVLALTNAMPVGLAESICLHFLDRFTTATRNVTI